VDSLPTPSANKRKGATFEIDLMRELREHGLAAERLRLAGKDDEGDLVAWSQGRPYVIEAKSGAMHPAQFIREVEIERANYAKARHIDVPTGLVVVKAPRKPILKSYVLTTLDRYFNLEV
jgi:Holliday junction resolvase